MTREHFLLRMRTMFMRDQSADVETLLRILERNLFAELPNGTHEGPAWCAPEGDPDTEPQILFVRENLRIWKEQPHRRGLFIMQNLERFARTFEVRGSEAKRRMLAIVMSEGLCICHPSGGASTYFGCAQRQHGNHGNPVR